MRVPLIFLLILISFSPNLSIDHKYLSSLYQFITVKTDSDGNNDPSSSISGGNGENQEGGGDMVVFKHRGKPKVIDHRHGTDGYNRTIYFLKKNVVRVVPTLNTLYHLGVREGGLVEVTEEDFRQFTVNFEPVPKPDSHLEGTLDGVIDDEIRKSDILQGIHLRNITYVGEYLNPAIIPFRGRLLLATGLAWGFRDNHNANEHLEFRWLNHTLFPFYSYSQRRKEFKTAEEKDSDPNPTDTYHLGINEQHVANVLDNRIVVGQDPRMVAVNDREVYVVFTNRFNNPIAMGIAYLRLNDTAEQMEVLSLHMAIQQSEERGNQKNWSPFLLPVHHHTHDTTSSPPHAHLRSHEVEYRRDIYFIQQINPLTVYEVKYEDISTPDGPIYGTLFSKADVIGIDHLHWNYGHLRGGTNAIYLPRRHEYLSLFHSSSIISGNTMTTYVFGAYTFTATHPFRLTAYTAYPILHPLLYKGPYDYLKNRHIDYVAFPMSISLINDDETVLLSFGHQDCRGFTAELNLHEILQNMIPIQSHNHERGNKEEKTERRVRRKRRNT